jgi:hypothetical protein
MYIHKILSLGVIACLSAGFALAQEPAKRPEWDQKKAVETVKKVIALEDKNDLPWDKIAWQTDPAKAAALAETDQKPLFVFFFLKKNVGPDTAPC